MQKSRISTIVAVVILVVLTLCFITACQPKGDAYGDKEQTVFITVNAREYEINTYAKYLDTALAELCQDKKLPYTTKDGSYGKYIVQIADITEGDNTFISIYHDIDDETLYAAGYDTEVAGKTYRSAAVGVSSLPIEDGAHYLLVAVTY